MIKKYGKKWLGTALILLLAFLGGRFLGMVSKAADSQTASADPDMSRSWGLSFPEEGKPPRIDVPEEMLAQYQALYRGGEEEKKLYLTFDCGYENGNTEKILDVLKKHGAPAAFFLVGNYLETSPELARRMAEEGHILGNHSYHHPDMGKKNLEAFAEELQSLSELCREVTGQPADCWFRPPQGKYSENSLRMAKDLGYHTIFWSLAYADWDEKNQPSREEAFEKLLKRIHPGAVVLLHNTSRTNAEILDELLTKWEEQGYRFAPLSELVS